MDFLHTFFQKISMAGLFFLSGAIGYWIDNFPLDGMAGTLLVPSVPLRLFTLDARQINL